jgi:hypothetical protein
LSPLIGNGKIAIIRHSGMLTEINEASLTFFDKGNRSVYDGLRLAPS